MSEQTRLIPTLSEEEWAAAMKALAIKVRRARKTCKHTKYKGMTVHGRCCPSCGTFMVDFGD